ncbi:MAG TPA: FG-GAP-like repeat-containing protein [Candidatus Didemnitutus sp.]|nr:FG-GAP-like repeat-containing protein [Candidatus Didemnitutus sp.]
MSSPSGFARFLCALAACALATGPVRGDAPALSARPLAPLTPPTGRTMFVPLTPEQTGVRTENRYADPKMRNELYQEFETGSIGTGVAIGDYDGDGRPDIFVVSKTEGCHLFRNLGDYKFEDVTEMAGVADHGADAGIWKSGVSFVDVNNDGRLDIYVCRFNAPNLLYINQGDGTFKEEAKKYGLDIADSSVMASFCDYDRDGWLDVYITTNLLDITKHSNGQRGYLLHHNRDGTFTNVTDRAGITDESQSHSATWWDYDNDGWPDLYVANDYGYQHPDKLYHNNRDGTFTNVIDQVIPHTSFSSMGADIGDVNNDGRIDFLVADMAATTHFKDQHSLADARAKTEEFDNASQTQKYHRNALLLNTGTGHTLEAAFLAGISTTDWTWSLRFEDFDNDGRLDLFVTNGFPRDPGVDVIRRMMNAESPQERIRIMYASPMQAENNLAFRNRGDLQFENVSAAWGVDQKNVSFGAAVGDLSGRGNLDIVYSSYHGSVTLLRNDCATGHRIILDLRGTTSNRFGVGATAHLESASGIQTRQLVLARGYMSSSEPMLHFGLGDDSLVKRLTITWPGGKVQTFTDLAADQRYTITEPAGPDPKAASEPPVSALFRDVSADTGLALESRDEPVDELAVQRLLPYRLNRRGPAIAVGRLSATTPEIIVIGGTTQDPLRFVVPSGNGRFAATPIGAAGPVDDGPVLLFDADGDGNTDLLVTRGGNALPAGSPEYQPKLWLGDGRGGFRPAPDDALPPLTLSAGAAAAADFDRSGHVGVFVGARLLPGQYPLVPSSALLRNRGGKFEDVTDAMAPGLREVGMVTAALWSDVDGDGWPDLLVATDWGQVHYFHNNAGKGFEDWTERAGFASAGTGWWTSLASADFNGDGRPDFVVGNFGLNTQYHAEPTHPALLYSGDFKGDGSQQLLEAYYEGEKIYPWRARRDLAAALPAIHKKFPQNDLYAKATLAEIVGEDRLAKATRFAATELRSGVFLSQPDGTYQFKPLPRLAQISPLEGMVAGDFDGDGHADIYAVQNFFSPIPAVGRFDGGLSQLLRGDGRGNFEAVPVRDSGLLVTGDARGLAMLDLDGDSWPDFVATRNNGRTVAFRNEARGSGRPLAVTLHGPGGNFMAIGARVVAIDAGGGAQMAEVQAGSGYYGQSTAVLFFGRPNGQPVTSLKIRWPNGQETVQPVPAGASAITVGAPAS